MTSNEPSSGDAPTSPNLPSAPVQAGDVLYGAHEIAAFLFGDRKYRRRVYSRIASKGLPVFRIGANICARKSVLLEWMARQEAGAWARR